MNSTNVLINFYVNNVPRQEDGLWNFLISNKDVFIPVFAVILTALLGLVVQWFLDKKKEKEIKKGVCLNCFTVLNEQLEQIGETVDSVCSAIITTNILESARVGFPSRHVFNVSDVYFIFHENHKVFGAVSGCLNTYNRALFVADEYNVCRSVVAKLILSANLIATFRVVLEDHYKGLTDFQSFLSLKYGLKVKSSITFEIDEKIKLLNEKEKAIDKQLKQFP